MYSLVSIIIPFYNEEKFLAKAVESVLAQSYPEIELILVDSSSTDRSLEIARSFVAASKNIKIVSIRDKSPGHARNTGIAQANGTFISFLDADDVLMPDAISLLIKNVNEYHSDVVIGKFNLNRDEIVTGWKLDGEPKSGVEAGLAMYNHELSYVVWAKLFKADLVKQCPFPEDLWFEDRVFMLRFFLKAKKVSFINNSVLQYQSHSDSITRRLISEKRIEDIFQVYLLELKTIKDHQQESILKRVIDRHEINAFIETMVFLYFDKKNVNDLKELEQCFNSNLNAFIQQLRINNSSLAKRDKLDVLILQLPQFIGWRLVLKILAILKKKKCDAIYKLRVALKN